MKLIVKVESAALSRKLRELQPIFKKNVEEMVKAGSKLAIRKGLEMTPPMGSGRYMDKSTQTFQEKLVARDIKRVYATASYAYDTITNHAAQSAFWMLVKGNKRGRSDAFRAAGNIIRDHSNNSVLKSAEIVTEPDVTMHSQARSRGRVSKANVRQIITQEPKLAAYIKQRQRNVGFLAAGWNAAVAELKVSRVPAWIKRHKSAPGTVYTRRRIGSYTLHMVNRVSYGAAAQLQRIVPYALQAARAGMEAAAHAIMTKKIKR
jgi:hypothetical protein